MLYNLLLLCILVYILKKNYMCWVCVYSLVKMFIIFKNLKYLSILKFICSSIIYIDSNITERISLKVISIYSLRHGVGFLFRFLTHIGYNMNFVSAHGNCKCFCLFNWWSLVTFNKTSIMNGYNFQYYIIN